MFGNGQWVLERVGPYSPRKHLQTKGKLQITLPIVKTEMRFFILELKPQTPLAVQKDVSSGMTSN